MSSAGDPARLAELWLGAYGRLVARATHEVNNALNGAAMNLEVVRLRAVAGRDAGAVAPFAAAAHAEQEAVAAMVAALLALGRPAAPGRPADVREALRHAAALVAPVVRHEGVTVEVDAGDAAPTAAPAVAVRLAVAWALERGAAGVRSGPVRCKLWAGREPTLEVSPADVPPAADEAVPALLADHGIRATAEGIALRLAFPAP